MNSDLATIIYEFIMNIFNTNSIPFTLVQVRTAIYNAFATDGNFFLNYRQALGVSSSSPNGMYTLVAYLTTCIIMVILFILLIRLFKWIFTLLFKLFRLN